MNIPHYPPRDEARARVTLRLQDFAQADRDHVYPAPAIGDWMLLGLLVVILLGNGLYVWHQRGWDDAIGRAVFFGLALFCLYWSAAVYTFKLSLSVRVGPHGLCLVRGPWRMELRWSEIERLAERTEATSGSRYRWVIATAYDGRRLQVREDMLANYAEFRVEVYERHRLWQEHGGTWGTNGGGPYVASDRITSELRWWIIAGCAFLLPAVYFFVLLPEVPFAGPVLLALAWLCLALLVRAVLHRQRYTVAPKFIACRRPLRPAMRLGWREIVRVERTRRATGFVVGAGIGLGRLALAVAARTDSRTSSFPWSPRMPEYLVLRGGGRRIRIRLHRLDRPDEMLAWVEFYERMGHQGSERRTRASTPLASRPVPELVPADLSGTFGPADPWASGQSGAPAGNGGHTETAAPGYAQPAGASPARDPSDLVLSRGPPTHHAHWPSGFPVSPQSRPRHPRPAFQTPRRPGRATMPGCARRATSRKQTIQAGLRPPRAATSTAPRLAAFRPHAHRLPLRPRGPCPLAHHKHLLRVPTQASGICLTRCRKTTKTSRPTA